MRRRAALSLCLGLAAGLALPALARAQSGGAGTVRIATEGGFPPYNALDTAGNPKGFEIDLGNALCAQAGLQCEWVVRSWSSLLPGLAAGDFEAIMAGMAITPSRRDQAAFTREYFPSADRPQGMFVGAHSFLSPDEALIAVQEGTIHEDYLRAAGYRVVTFPTAGAALDAVLDGDCELTFGSPDYLEQRVFRTSRALSIISRVEIEAGGAAIALNPARGDLLRRFNSALDALETDGTIEKLRQKWFTRSTDI